jgi:D-3-phosphoglycerate dehydrogenase
VPGVVGLVGTILGNAGVNIGELALSRGREGESAVSVISLDTAPGGAAVSALRSAGPVRDVRVVAW